MTPNEYQQEALRTERTRERPVYTIKTDTRKRLINGLMGLNGEAGEAIDLFKKYLFQGHEFDREHLAKELGDVAWYLAISTDALGYTLEEILQMNVEKLRARYPDGFDEKRSIHRREGDL